MITAYVSANGMLRAQPVEPHGAIPEDAVWIDLMEPTPEEERFVDEALGLDVPSEEEMQEIEVSSRLYQERNAIYMTATVMIGADTSKPGRTPVTFVLVGHRLLTLRYAEPLPFRYFAAKARRHVVPSSAGEEVLAGLLDAIVDRVADILERVQSELDTLSSEIFARRAQGVRLDFDELLRRVGRTQALTTEARESLVSIARLLSFIGRPGEMKLTKSFERGFKTIARDVMALSDHASFLSGNINFVLDATLGLINSEQNGIIKIFSVAAVVFLPPTLIASIYGMNFQFMPELSLKYGYVLALALMVISAILPYWYFKRRGWL
ncbi:MAG: magnesium transporter CorA family protein [Parvibaculum sp.]|uniref:magnesium transporter CorA family protein n=1 Tax=Parvibaculum sp. TaxID=2024848 RepID=UPI0028467A96|nr:magnesium transporter CorA family protein [Parvibaculum sp.]MDR3500487.1 magnesium transporter CorA family protein [Parvibaculum sp.]